MYCVTRATVEADNKLPLPHHDIVPTSQTANGWQVFGSGLVVDGCPRIQKTQWIFNIDPPTPSLTMSQCLVGQNMLGCCEIQIPSLLFFLDRHFYFYLFCTLPMPRLLRPEWFLNESPFLETWVLAGNLSLKDGSMPDDERRNAKYLITLCTIESAEVWVNPESRWYQLLWRIVEAAADAVPNNSQQMPLRHVTISTIAPH